MSDIAECVVPVLASLEEGGELIGSGVVLGSRWVVTNHHVVRGLTLSAGFDRRTATYDLLQLGFSEGESGSSAPVRAKVVAHDRVRDLALLLTESEISVEPARLLSELSEHWAFELGTTGCRAFGYAQASAREPAHCRLGGLTATVRAFDHLKRAQAAMSMTVGHGIGLLNGFSGGGILQRCLDGWALAGVIRLGGGKSSTSECVPADVVREFLLQISGQTIGDRSALVVAPDDIFPERTDLEPVANATMPAIRDVVEHARSQAVDGGVAELLVRHPWLRNRVIEAFGLVIAGKPSAAVITEKLRQTIAGRARWFLKVCLQIRRTLIMDGSVPKIEALQTFAVQLLPTALDSQLFEIIEHATWSEHKFSTGMVTLWEPSVARVDGRPAKPTLLGAREFRPTGNRRDIPHVQELDLECGTTVEQVEQIVPCVRKTLWELLGCDDDKFLSDISDDDKIDRTINDYLQERAQEYEYSERFRYYYVFHESTISDRALEALQLTYRLVRFFRLERPVGKRTPREHRELNNQLSEMFAPHHVAAP